MSCCFRGDAAGVKKLRLELIRARYTRIIADTPVRGSNPEYISVYPEEERIDSTPSFPAVFLAYDQMKLRFIATRVRALARVNCA